jgi:hypothetical protein
MKTPIEFLEEAANDGMGGHYPSVYPVGTPGATRGYNYIEVVRLMEKYARQFIDENVIMKSYIEDLEFVLKLKDMEASGVDEIGLYVASVCENSCDEEEHLFELIYEWEEENVTAKELYLGIKKLFNETTR